MVIKTETKACKIQRSRFESGKRDVAKAVRRWYKRTYGVPYKSGEWLDLKERKA